MWCCVVLCGVVWCCVVLCGVVWCCVVLCGVVWCCVVLCGVVWCCVVLWGSGVCDIRVKFNKYYLKNEQECFIDIRKSTNCEFFKWLKKRPILYSSYEFIYV